MAWIRQLPPNKDGVRLWAATVRTPAGRITESHRLKGRVEHWAAGIEDDVRRGDFIDPRLAEVEVGEWHARCRDARHLEQASRRRDESHWRCHVEPRWGKTQLGAILKPDVSAWVVEMKKAGVGAATIEGAVGVLRALLEQAIDARILRAGNPAARVKKPKRDAHVDRVLDADEEKRLLEALDAVAAGRVDARLFVELIADTGLRWEEAAAIPPELVDTKRQRIHIAWVMERDGTARPYAKSQAGNRMVTYGDALSQHMTAAKLAGRAVPGVFPKGGPTRLVFTSLRGDQLRYSGWHRSVWTPAIRGLPERQKVKGHAYRPAIPGAELGDPQPTPHDLRHTYGTRLADEGVPVHDIMALMGHEDIRSAQRYLHAREERFERARQAMKRARGM